MKEITNLLKAGFPAIAISTTEEGRAELAVAAAVKAAGRTLYVWSVTEGLARVLEAGGVTEFGDTQDPMAMLGHTSALPDKVAILLRDVHPFIGRDASPMLIRKFRDVMMAGKQRSQTLILMGHDVPLPPEWVKEAAVVEWRLPTREELQEVIGAVAMSGKVKVAEIEWDTVLDAAAGLTTTEAENAAALSVVETRGISPDVIRREKAATVRKNGILEIVESSTTLQDIGGLELLKGSLHEKRNLFTKAAREYGLPTPRGTLVVGQPGTGKSLTATATARTFNLPLLRLEAGRLFGSLVGQSEANWRTAFATAKAVAPCILWIDEVDGLFAGAGGASTDGGTTQRVLKAILQDMQMAGDGIFFMLTANDIDRLPDPLIDRLEVWAVDLPSRSEREAIWKIQIEKRSRKSKAFDLARLAEATDGFSGRQIERVWLDAMTRAFNDRREPSMADCEAVAARTVPTSKLMGTEIEARRQRLNGRAMPASAPEGAADPKTAGRRLTV
ncbi:MAG: AAA family ATPase [Verrucomicrobia bacterium]|nr:AAA family ATPase [Verrucomicrobiota bacterium]